MSGLLYLFRHGHTEGQGLMIGQADVALSQEGVEQFRLWRDALAQIPFSAAWASPLSRARQSAAIILAGNSGSAREPVLVPDLREISLGLWEGKNKDWVRGHFAEAWQARGKDMEHVPPPGGESFQSLARRVLPAFSALCGEAAQHAASLAVAHQAVNRVILAHVCRLPLASMRETPQPHAALNILELGAGGRIRLLEQRFLET